MRVCAAREPLEERHECRRGRVRPLTWISAARLVQAVEDAFDAADLDAIRAGFTEDPSRGSPIPRAAGREAIMRFLTARFARTRNYRLKRRCAA